MSVFDDEVSDMIIKHNMSIIGICKNLDITKFGLKVSVPLMQ